MKSFDFTEPITTERLTLRLMRESDANDIHAYQGRDDVCEYLLYEARTLEQVQASVIKHSTATRLEKDGDYWQLAIDLNGRVIGDVYFTIKSTENQSGEIGWVMNPEYHAQGYATEAASAVLGLVFGKVELHRVIAELDPRNAASIALCKRLGMRAEAHHIEDLWFRGAWADTGIYAILDREWAARGSSR